MSDLVAIGDRNLTARISPLGAELWSLTDGEGREYMTDADPAFWTGHAPLLFPIVGGLKDGTYRLGDREFAMDRHGFARRSNFALIEQRENVARFRLTDSEATRAVYPFAFELEMGFRIEGMRLEMEAVVRNPGEEPFPFSFGYHPAFAWPLPGGGDKLAHRIDFAREELADIRRLDADGLVACSEATSVSGKSLALHPELFEADAVILDDMASRHLAYRGQSDAPRLEIACPDTPWLGIWQKPGANYICIEPWHGLADAADFNGDFREKRGVISLPPGEVRSFRMDVTVVTG